jgi:hypothetical protein
MKLLVGLTGFILRVNYREFIFISGHRFQIQPPAQLFSRKIGA